MAGLDAAEVLDASAALRATEEVATSSPDLTNLPRKFKTAISGCANQCTAHEVNDISFVGVRGPDGRPGFDLWVGGGLSTNPMLAQRLGVFVPAERVPEVWAGVAGLFRDYGYRRLRSRARLKFLVADWGAERFREVLEREYLEGNGLADGPPPPAPAPGSRDHIGVHRQRDGLYYVGVAPHTGRTSGTQLWQVADLAEAYGSGRVRTTIEQKLLILDVPERAVPELVAELESVDLTANPSAFRRGTMACTGIEFCKLAIVETKGRARDLYSELDRRLPGLRHANHDQREWLPEFVRPFPARGHRTEGLDRRRGGGLPGAPGRVTGTERGFGRELRGLKVTADGLTDYVERLLRDYQTDRAAGEQFASWGPAGPCAPRCWRTRGRAIPASGHDRGTASAVLLPVLRRGEPAPVRGERRPVAVPRLRARIPPDVRGGDPAAAPGPASGRTP